MLNKNPSNKKEVGRHNSKELCPKIIIEDMQFFPFKGVIFHTEKILRFQQNIFSHC